MSEKEYVVPKGMLKASTKAYWETQTGDKELEAVLKAALRWLDEELGKSDGIAPMLGGTYQDGWVGAWRHIRRMFLAAEPEVPEEIKDLLLVDAVTFKLPNGNSFPGSAESHNKAVIEAYRRGQKSGKESQND